MFIASQYLFQQIIDKCPAFDVGQAILVAERVDCILDESLVVRRHVCLQIGCVLCGSVVNMSPQSFNLVDRWPPDYVLKMIQHSAWQQGEDASAQLPRSIIVSFRMRVEHVCHKPCVFGPLFQRWKLEVFIVVVHGNAKQQMGHAMTTFRSDDAATQQFFLDSVVLDDRPNFGLGG